MNILDFSTTNSQETDYIINVANSNPVNLGHAVFYNKTGKKVVISTGAGGTGTVLTETTDWTSGGAFPDASFPSSISPDVGYTTISIVNATYHSADLYISYYPITDLFNADLWNNTNTIPSIGDYDISASDTTYDLSIINSYPIGYRFRVSWYGGDSSNTFSFTDNSETIDGAPIADYTGDGTGHLDLLKTGTGGEYLAINGGEVWDNDGGNFTNEQWKKQLNGMTWQAGQIALSAYPTAGTFPIAFSATPRKSNKGTDGSNAQYVTVMVPTSTTAYNLFAVDAQLGTGLTTGTYFWELWGRWTDSFPRKGA